MKTQFSIEKTEGRIRLTAPYSASNNEIYRSRGGKFSDGAWVFDDTPAVETMLDELFGNGPLCRAELDLTNQVETWRDRERPVKNPGNELKLEGYVLASRRGRDSRVETPDGVQLYRGAWRSSGGSVKNPCPTWEDGTVLHAVVRLGVAEKHRLTVVEYSPRGPDGDPSEKGKQEPDFDAIAAEIWARMTDDSGRPRAGIEGILAMELKARFGAST